MNLEQYLARYGINDLDRYARRLRDLQTNRALAEQLSTTTPWQITPIDSTGRIGSNRPALARFYNLLASAPFRYLFETQKVNSFRLLIPRLARLVGPHARVLDVGCHAGIITNYLALERPSARIVGLDLAHEAIAVARHAARDLHLRNVEFVCGDLLEVHWRRRFDLVIATSVLMDLVFGPPDVTVTGSTTVDDDADPDFQALAPLSDAELDELIETTRLMTMKVSCLASAVERTGRIFISIDFLERDHVERRLADRHRALIRAALATNGFGRWTESTVSYQKYRDRLHPDTGGLQTENVTSWLILAESDCR